MDDIQYQINSLHQRMNVIENKLTVIADTQPSPTTRSTPPSEQWKHIDCNLSQLEDDMMALRTRVSHLEHPPL